MKILKELLESQHCKLVEVNPNKLSFAFLMPKEYGAFRVSATLPKPIDKATEKELMNWIADSIIGARKRVKK